MTSSNAFGTNLGEGIWSEGSGTLELVAREGSHAPGTGSSFYFSNLATPVLNDSGQTAFYGIVREDTVGPIYSGAWTGHAGAVRLVAVDGSQAPGTPSGVTFFGLINGRVLMNAAGHTAFSSFVRGSTVNETNDIGIWSDSSGSLELVAREGAQAPGIASGVQFNRLSQAVLNDAGEIAFAASTTDAGTQSTLDGIWSGTSGNLRLVTREGNQAPGTSSGVNYLAFTEPVLNGAGQTAFYALLTGSGVDNTNDQGIWSEGSGTLDLVARKGSQAPGTPTGVNFGGFNFPVLNAAGETAFYAGLTGAGVDGTNNFGLWSNTSGTLQLVARSGSQATGTPPDARFGGFGPAVLNAAGQIAFRAHLALPPPPPRGGTASGPEEVSSSIVDSTNDGGIWTTDLSGTLHLIVREGDLLEVAPSDFRRIASLDFIGGTGNGDGLPSGFNDLGQLAFHARFTDGSSGIFVSNAVAVPEPAHFILAFIALVELIGVSCRRSGSRT
ncbi:MAG: hypothetical protein L0228_20740 [Planctomycetes bacterium]|nr:hypothetical protein [Planctomycetota bacterium]